MTRAISRPSVTQACLCALGHAEIKYSYWSGGTTMRAAPESLVQVVLAEELAALGITLRLEASVRSLYADSGIEPPASLPRNERGRIDIALYFKSSQPRFIVEVKKLRSAKSMNEDQERIIKLLQDCPNIQNGIMLGYATSPHSRELDTLLDAARHESGTRIVRRMSPVEVQGKDGKPRFLAGAVFRVDPFRPRL